MAISLLADSPAKTVILGMLISLESDEYERVNNWICWRWCFQWLIPVHLIQMLSISIWNTALDGILAANISTREVDLTLDAAVQHNLTQVVTQPGGKCVLYLGLMSRSQCSFNPRPRSSWRLPNIRYDWCFTTCQILVEECI
jgi:hypothetical protein